MSRRSNIVNAIVALLNTELDGIKYTSNIYGTAENKLQFFDEISNYPYLSVTAGTEFREYQPGHFKWAFLNITIRIYSNGPESSDEVEMFLEDIEEVLDNNNNLSYDTGETLDQISITNITTSEGVLEPLEAGEMGITVMYALQGPCPI